MMNFWLLTVMASHVSASPVINSVPSLMITQNSMKSSLVKLVHPCLILLLSSLNQMKQYCLELICSNLFREDTSSVSSKIIVLFYMKPPLIKYLTWLQCLALVKTPQMDLSIQRNFIIPISFSFVSKELT